MFPTAAFNAQLARNKPRAVPTHEKVVDFFEANPEFELAKHKVVPFLKEAGADAGADPEVVQSVEKLQRVFQLAGDYRKTVGLLDAGFSAAADIVDAGRTHFVADATRVAGMDPKEAEDKHFFRSEQS